MGDYLDDDQRKRVAYHAGVLFDALPAVQAATTRQALIDDSLLAVENGEPVTLPGDGRTISVEAILKEYSNGSA